MDIMIKPKMLKTVIVSPNKKNAENKITKFTRLMKG
jgi:hypothetical protein